MDTRVAVMGIIVENLESVEALNSLLHEYGRYIIGRMGLPYKEKNINICAYMMPTASIVWLGTAKVMTKSTHTSKSTTSIRIFSQIQPCMPSS